MNSLKKNAVCGKKADGTAGCADIGKQGGVGMIFKFEPYEINVDIEKTRAFYENAELVSEQCTCDGCQNFAKAVDILPESVKGFFTSLGIDMRKAAECYVYNKNEDGSLFYGGIYHLCGTILRGKSTEVTFSDGTCWKEITLDFQIAFGDNICLLEEDFPLPVIQLNITANIPWVLEKENPYQT